MAHQEAVLITGGNTGLGLQIVRALCSSDKAYSIIIGGRSLNKAQEAADSTLKEFPSTQCKISPLQVDIEHDGSIRTAFGQVQSKFGRLDVLVNNAGGQFDQEIAAGRMTEREMWNQSWNVNTVGTQIMTSVFVPLLLHSSNPRLLFITSGTSTLAGTENMALAVNKYTPKGWPKPNFDGKTFNIPAYRSSKTGMNMMMREWYRTLHEDGVKVWCASPGFLATGLGGPPDAKKAMGAGDPAVAGIFIKDILEGSRDDDVGKVIVRDGIQQW